MHNEQQGEAEQIERGLSEAQRSAILCAGPLRHGWDTLYVCWSVSRSVAIRLSTKGLIISAQDRKLTPLGLSVRTLLESEES